MEFETGPRYSHQNAAMSYADPQYYYDDRNIQVIGSNAARSNPRGYSMGGPVGGPRLRGHSNNMGPGRDEVENGHARRRIAVACARCRKRKIRCSGDPGDGSGCNNCKGAGVDASVCQFHRVGSGEITRVLDGISIAHSLASMNNPRSVTMIPDYSAAGPLYPRGSYPHLDTKPAHSSTWTDPYQEETSPVETYNLGQPSSYQSIMNPMSTGLHGNSYDGICRYNSMTPASMYGAHGPPYLQQMNTNMRASAPSETLSPLNMSSLQHSLPVDPHARPMPEVPQRQLPIPQPSPAQTTRNAVDQLQDQRLRSHGGSHQKPVSFGQEGDLQATITANSSGALSATQVTTSAPLNTGDSGLGYIPATVSEAVAASSAGSQQPQQLNFGASSLFDTMPAPAMPTTQYSNFRNYKLPASSLIDSKPTSTSRQSSQTSLYSFNPEHSSKHRPAGEGIDSSLVSGHRYTPLDQNQNRQPQHQPSMKSMRCESFNRSGVLFTALQH